MTTVETETVPTTEDSEEEFQTEQVLTIVGGHFVHDTYSAFAAPLLPLIIEKLSLSLAQAGGLLSIMQLPAVLSPLVGYLADRVSLRYFVILAPAITATLMSSIGLAPNYVTLAILLFATGISVTTFHAPAPAMIGRISGNQLGKGMSFFMAGGESGRTIGPLVAVWAVSTWTLEGSYRIMVVGWVASAILYWRLRNIAARSNKRQNFREMLPGIRRLLIPLFGIVVPRQFLTTALSVFLPTFMRLEGASLGIAAASLTIWELAGVGGALVSGTLSDRLGRKTLLMAGMVSSPILMLILLGVSSWLLVPVLLALGFAALSVTPVLLAVVQEYMPNNRAVANGLFLLFGFVTRSVAAFLLGVLGDMFGLRSAFLWSAVIAMIAIPFIFSLSSPEQ